MFGFVNIVHKVIWPSLRDLGADMLSFSPLSFTLTKRQCIMLETSAG